MDDPSFLDIDDESDDFLRSPKRPQDAEQPTVSRDSKARQQDGNKRKPEDSGITDHTTIRERTIDVSEVPSPSEPAKINGIGQNDKNPANLQCRQNSHPRISEKSAFIPPSQIFKSKTWKTALKHAKINESSGEENTIKAVLNLKRSCKIEKIVVVAKTLDLKSNQKGVFCIFEDPTGSIQGGIHSEVVSQYGELKSDSILILSKIFKPDSEIADYEPEIESQEEEIDVERIQDQAQRSSSRERASRGFYIQTKSPILEISNERSELDSVGQMQSEVHVAKNSSQESQNGRQKTPTKDCKQKGLSMIKSYTNITAERGGMEIDVQNLLDTGLWTP